MAAHPAKGKGPPDLSEGPSLFSLSFSPITFFLSRSRFFFPFSVPPS
jgi:hypothetical protein